jgi:hypothetical protein
LRTVWPWRREKRQVDETIPTDAIEFFFFLNNNKREREDMVDFIHF